VSSRDVVQKEREREKERQKKEMENNVKSSERTHRFSILADSLVLLPAENRGHT